jgi:hypothetical protein
MNRKKVRGFSRHLRSHQLRAAAPITPINFTALDRYLYDYKNLGLAPWRVSEKPPYPIRRLWVAHLVAGFFNWQRSLQSYRQDYLLAVIIKEPDFADSRLRVVVGEQRTRYGNDFPDPVDTLPLPQEYRDIAGVNDLEWTTHRQLYAYNMEEFEEQHAWLARRNHWHYKGDNGEPLILVQHGWMWVGRAPMASSTPVA